jgi:hypothetical protein
LREPALPHDSGGHLLQSCGTWGMADPGQFHLPHSIIIDETHTVDVCDRENHRVQVITPNGEFIEMWTGIQRPMDIAEFTDGNFLISEGTRDNLPSRKTVPGRRCAY